MSSKQEAHIAYVKRMREMFFKAFGVKPPGEVDMRTNLTEKERADLWHDFCSAGMVRRKKIIKPAKR